MLLHGGFLTCLASIDAILRDHHNNFINRKQLPLRFDISVKGKQLATPRKARRRAVRGLSSPQQSNSCTSTLDSLLMPVFVFLFTLS